MLMKRLPAADGSACPPVGTCDMRIGIVAIGKVKERYLQQAIDDYFAVSPVTYARRARCFEEPFTDRDSEARRAQLRDRRSASAGLYGRDHT